MCQLASVYELVQSHRITAMIYAAAKLNLAEAIGGETKTVDELASLVSADESALRRLLVSLTTLGLCRQAERDRFAMTDLGRQLDETADPSFKDWLFSKARRWRNHGPDWPILFARVRQRHSCAAMTIVMLQPAMHPNGLAGSTPRWSASRGLLFQRS